MAIPADHIMIWTEVYTGIPGRPRTKILDYGWCAFPKDTSDFDALERAREFLRKEHPVTKGAHPVIMTYPIWNTSGFKTGDRVLAIFG